ncbi:MAG: DNA polymerase IV [Planctomycetes bacterium]|nr:DNA polymerase IV [Planctomycetota bacterium]
MSRDLRLPPRTRRILHVDIDAFLASVEQALHQELRGRPVVVGGLPHERNLVMSCSYEARAHGVRSGMLLGEAARRCPQAIFRRGDSQAANRLREQVTRRLLEYSPRVEVTSIDDFYVDLGGCAHAHGSAFAIACELRRRVQDELQLPTTWGLGTSKLAARVAGKFAKPQGVFEILPGHERAFFARLPLDLLPGAGKAMGAQLSRYGLRTCGDLALVPREILYTSFGAQGLELHARALAQDDEAVEATHELGADGALVARPPLSIRRDGTFEPEEGRRAMVEAMLSYLVERAASRLRAHGAAARSVAVELVYVDTRADAHASPEREPGADPAGSAASSLRPSKRRALATPSDCTAELARAALRLLRELPRRRALVKRVGVALHGVQPSTGWQGTLFSAQLDEPSGDRANERAPDVAGPTGSQLDRQRRADRALDALRERHGFGRVLRASQLELGRRYELGRDGYTLRTPSLNQ